MQVTAVVIGAGSRGKIYAGYALAFPEKFKIVGVAEPRAYPRNLVKEQHDLKDDRCFSDWKELSELPKFADCVIICTQDQNHLEPAITFAKQGYHILLEKPMAVTPEDCRAIYEVCKERNIILCVCHVLRYHPCVQKLKQLIDLGTIGQVVNINHVEPVGYWHFAHSFVRGNWGNTQKSTFSLLSKCCHDVDLILYWMDFKKCTKVSSFGSLFHFRKENKPEGANKTCLDCAVEKSCIFSAKKIYLDPKPTKPSFPWKAVCDIEDCSGSYLEKLTEAVRDGPYGKCVYDTDNDVCDNQVVNFQFDDGTTAHLTMSAFTKDVCERKTTIYGTKGELRWGLKNNYSVQHYDFSTNRCRDHPCQETSAPANWGHGGSDYYTIQQFVHAVATGSKDAILTGPKISLASHLLTFAAEHSRLTGETVNPQQNPRWIP